MTSLPKVTELARVRLEDYRPIVGDDLIDDILRLARPLAGMTVQHINSAAVGGGVAEILKRLVPLMEDVGLKADWDVIEGTPEFFHVTKTFHNAFHGQPVTVTETMLSTYLEVSRHNYPLVRKADFVIIHDQQPLGLTGVKEDRGGKWVWYCHIDPIYVDRKVWDFLRPFAEKCHASIYHIPQYAKGIKNREYILSPAIDPLSDKNREVTEKEKEEVARRLGLDLEKPIILQVSRFDRLKDPVGVIKAFRLVRRYLPCQLILAGGGASDDPEGQQVLAEVREAADNDPDILIYDLPPTSDLEINVLQRLATVVVQKSIREGFGLTVTEAMWKGKPLVATAVGGIRYQVEHEKTGLLSHTIEGTAWNILRFLQDRELAQVVGQRAREQVRRRFLLPVYLRDWLILLHLLKDKH